MKKNDFRNPLIQSGAILLFVFFLISIVANSQTDGFFGGFVALISGLISGVLFIIALFVSILFSIAVIIGLFFAAVSMHSVDKARSMFDQLLDSLKTLYAKLPGRALLTRLGMPDPAAKPVERPVYGGEAAAPPRAVQQARSEQGIDELRKALAALEQRVAALQGGSGSAASEPAAASGKSHQAQESTAAAVAELAARMDELSARTAEQFEAVHKDLDDLYEKTSVPDIVAGILSYIDLPEDREEITKKAEEAVSRGMTYSQIDDFFKSSLPPHLFETLSSHPRLTKDFIRSVKKKFE